jgi:hypothetical protein
MNRREFSKGAVLQGAGIQAGARLVKDARPPVVG